MLALCIAAHAFSAPTIPVTHMARSSPVQMKAMEMPSRRAAVLSAASLLMVPLAAQAAPEDYVGGCMFCPTPFATRASSHRPVLCLFIRHALTPPTSLCFSPFAVLCRRHGEDV